MRAVNSEMLRDLEERASALLGAAYPRLVAEREHGLGSKTRPKNPHRLINNLRRLAGTRECVERGHGAIDAAAIVEVTTLLLLLDRWRGDENWRAIVTSLVDADSYAHMMVLLATEKLYSDMGNLVVLERTSAQGRSFDLRLLARAGQSMALEVKAPQRLRQGSSRPFTPEEARKVVLSAMDKAGPSDGGQLAPDRCGILVIGGFGLKQADMNNLRRGAAALFHRRRRLGHIASIVVLSLGVHLQNVNVVDGAPVVVPGTSLNTTVAVESCRNPGYLGTVVVTERSPPGWSQLGPHTEMDVQDHPSLARYR